MISNFAGDLLGGQSPTILGDGNQIRDFISVNDAVDSIILATDAFQVLSCVTNGNTRSFRSNKMRLHTFNVGTGIPTTINDLPAMMVYISGVDLKPVYKLEMDPE